jgi:hypothetical protein
VHSFVLFSIFPKFDGFEDPEWLLRAFVDLILKASSDAHQRHLMNVANPQPGSVAPPPSPPAPPPPPLPAALEASDDTVKTLIEDMTMVSIGKIALA